MAKGRIRISRVSSSNCDDFISITVADDLSGVQFFTARMSINDYADLLTQREPECQYELKYLENVGKIREHKHEDVFIPNSGWKHIKEVAENAVRDLEVDGWKARMADVTNQHNFRGTTQLDGVQGKLQRVLFTRFVDRDTNHA